MSPGVAGRDRPVLLRIGIGVAASTALLTANFVGLLALLTGRAAGVGARLPGYVLVMAVAFVVVVVVLELRRRPPRVVLGTAAGVSVAALLFVGLAGEGIVFASRNPGAVIASNLLFYLLAAGLIATGLGYWGVRHWRELTDTLGV